jgi:hypothetical protein
VPVWHYALRLRIRRRSGVDGRRHARRTTGSFRDACSEAAIPLPAKNGHRLSTVWITKTTLSCSRGHS